MNQALHNVLQENEGPKSAERIGDGAIMSDANNVTGGISDGRSAAYARCLFPGWCGLGQQLPFATSPT